MLTVIGDVHGKYNEYKSITEHHKHTVQLGDFGFDYSIFDSIDHGCHKFFGGNHDNYDIIKSSPNNIGEFGVQNIGGVEFFFARGELSFDKQHRVQGVDWWEQEEISMREMYNCIELYRQCNPDIVITHGCPSFLISEANLLPRMPWAKENHVISRTGQMLDELFEIRQPRLWIFGHHHKSIVHCSGDTTFRCLAELECYTIH